MSSRRRQPRAWRRSSTTNSPKGSRPIPGRFSALATLPLERSRRIGQGAGARRAASSACAARCCFQNVNGVALADPRFLPLYELANDLDAVLYIHPTHPLGVEAMTDFWLMPLVGFLFDTTLAAAKLVFAGIPEKFPRIQLGADPSGRRHPVSGRAPRPRSSRVQGMPREHPAPSQRIPEKVLLRHSQLQPGRA